MSTAYTSAIYEGKNTSFKNFAMQCARAFGAYIEQRDDSLDVPPKEIKVNNYHLDALNEAKEEWKKYKSMSNKACEVEAKKRYNEVVKENKETIEKKRRLKVRYINMLTQVYEWTPPSKDHDDLKKFMIDQINDSIEYDCDESYNERNKPKHMTGDEWQHFMIKIFEDDIKYHTEQHIKEIEQTNKNNEWIKQLRESLKGK